MEYIFLLFVLLKAASEASLIVIAYAVYRLMKLKVPMGPSISQRVWRALKAF